MSSISQQIEEIRTEWGARLLILGHHYQRSSVIVHADERGDSLELARAAARQSEAERIVFCGVRFMAESADILTGPDQMVFMPESSAGCPMADMATAVQMEQALQDVAAHGDDWLPVVYVNSSVEVKACCGRHGGSACTSSNAARVFEWAFDRKKRVFFLPDEHLGVNTAHDLGIGEQEIAVYDPGKERGGLSPETIGRARVIVWKGFCLVHTAFSGDHVRMVRESLPEARIIVHPETPREVLRMCDAHGSTSQIIEYVKAAPEGSTVVVGTELNLVQRLAEENRPRVTVKALSPSVCANMARTNERNLLDTLLNWPPTRETSVPDEIAADARKSLETMLSL